MLKCEVQSEGEELLGGWNTGARLNSQLDWKSQTWVLTPQLIRKASYPTRGHGRCPSFPQKPWKVSLTFNQPKKINAAREKSLMGMDCHQAYMNLHSSSHTEEDGEPCPTMHDLFLGYRLMLLLENRTHTFVIHGFSQHLILLGLSSPWTNWAINSNNDN